jgi:hypothetical protein
MTTCLSKDDAGAPICNRGKQQYGGADAAMGDRDQKKPYLAVTCHIRAEMRVPVYVTVATHRHPVLRIILVNTHARRTNDMINLPDGIVSVHLGNERYRGAYYFRGDKLVVTAYGMRESSADLEVLGGGQTRTDRHGTGVAGDAGLAPRAGPLRHYDPDLLLALS